MADEKELPQTYTLPEELGGTPPGQLGQDYVMPGKGWQIPPEEQFKDQYYTPYPSEKETHGVEYPVDPTFKSAPHRPYYQEWHGMTRPEGLDEDMTEPGLTRKIRAPARVIINHCVAI